MEVSKGTKINNEVWKGKLILSINAGSAEVTPALGTILGNLGVNTAEFCKQFNERTQVLPEYFNLITTIYITPTNKFKFSVSLPSTGSILTLLSYEKKVKIKVGDRYNEEIIKCVKLYSVIKLAVFKFPKLPLKKSLGMIIGSVNSAGLIIVKD